MSNSEAIIRSIWRELLPESTGADDEDFFGAGGTSLDAATFVARLREEGLDVPLTTVFEDGRLSEILVEAMRAAD